MFRSDASLSKQCSAGVRLVEFPGPRSAFGSAATVGDLPGGGLSDMGPLGAPATIGTATRNLRPPRPGTINKNLMSFYYRPSEHQN